MGQFLVRFASIVTHEHRTDKATLIGHFLTGCFRSVEANRFLLQSPGTDGKAPFQLTRCICTVSVPDDAKIFMCCLVVFYGTMQEFT